MLNIIATITMNPLSLEPSIQKEKKNKRIKKMNCNFISSMLVEYMRINDTSTTVEITIVPDLFRKEIFVFH
jgi:hypothetical protein